MQGVAGAGQFDLDCASVRCAALSPDESGLLHALEVTSESGAFNPDGARQGRAGFAEARP